MEAERKGNGKAIIDLAMAAIMVASLAAMLTLVAAAIDIKSSAEDMTVRAAAIDVEASPTTQVVGNDIVVTTTSGPGVRVIVTLSGASGVFDPTKGDCATRGTLTAGNSVYTANIPSDGTLTAVISSPTPGVVTIRAGIDANGNGVIDAGEITDIVDVTFKGSTTTVEVPAKFTIGEMITIRGMTNSGVDMVAIFVDNILQRLCAVEADNTYEWEWYTSLGIIEAPIYTGSPLTPGAITIKVFEIHPIDVVAGIGDGLDTCCGGDGPVVPGRAVSIFFDPANQVNPRSADASTTTLAVDDEPTISIFDTEPSENPYPSIMGTHKGTIKPSDDINVSKLYTYPCVGTGGHTESIELYENTTLIASGTWTGYHDDDWHNVTIAPSVILQAGHTYNYTIVTGSYPQIIHEPSKEVTGGTITCTSFVDANGKIYTDWIPAIRLE